jgi:hypothetical protein
VKVGVTRHHQIPTRWIDQGASSAVILAKTPNRHIAGVIEVWLKKYFPDKTNWRAMLQNKEPDGINLIAEKSKAAGLLPAELKKYFYPDDKITEIQYPVVSFPEKINSLSFDKEGKISGQLSGIKGQYLFFSDGSVINLRKFAGYYLRVES